jgi:hypothetical protein
MPELEFRGRTKEISDRGSSRRQIWYASPAPRQIWSVTLVSPACDVAGHPSWWLVFSHGVAGHPSRLWFEGIGVAGAGVEGLDALLGVEGVSADEFAGDEDVTVGAGDDDGGGLAVVLGPDRDLVAPPDADGAAKDSDPVGGGGLTEGTALGSGFGGLGEDLDGGTPVEAAVGPLIVVKVAEAVELGLQLGQAGGRGLLGEPFLQGLM